MAKRILVVAGTRPELIKLGPVVWRLAEPPGIEVTYLATGQHGDASMVGKGIVDAGEKWLPPTAELEWVRSDEEHQADQADWMSQAAIGAGRIFDWWSQHRPSPDAVVVQGDTASALAGAQAAKRFFNCPLVHVEAGFRCFHGQVPEEAIRIRIDRVADLLLCPSRLAASFVQRDRKAGSVVAITGQTGLDALWEASPASAPSPPVDGPWALLTLHRARWDADEGHSMVHVAEDVQNALDPDIQVVWPVHPRWRSHDLSFAVGGDVVDPIPYADLAALLRSPLNRPALIVTDSGGLVEEAYALGIPCVIVRPTTERWEALAEGRAVLHTGEAEPIRDAIEAALSTSIPRGGTEYSGPITASPSEWCVHHIAAMLGCADEPREGHDDGF